MFFCRPCKEQHDWPESFFSSVGKCEICGVTTHCFNVPSSRLPEPPKPPQTWTIPAEPGPEVTHVRDRYRNVWTRMGGNTWGHAEFKERTATWPWDILLVRCWPLTDVSAEYGIDRDLFDDVE